MFGLILDNVSRVVLVFCIAFLGFVAGAFVMLSEVYPAPFFRHAYLAGSALFQQRTAGRDPFKTDLWQKARTEERGVTVYDPQKAQHGYTLYTSGHDNKAFLIAIGRARMVHAVQPGLGHEFGGEKAGPRFAHLFPPLRRTAL